VDIPKKSLVVFTGVSGSGKSSLAFDTIYAEGQRRYIESLSAYARQFLGQMEKPKFETIRGLSPTIAIEQKATSKNPRSTVGTITEIYDYLRVLFARVGTQYCPQCGKVVGRGDAASMVEQILQIPEGTKILILAPLLLHRKGEQKELFQELTQQGFTRVRIDGVIHELAAVTALSKNKKHTIEAVIDRLVIAKGPEFKGRLTDSVEAALKKGQSQLVVHVVGREDLLMSEERSCCGQSFPQLDPPLFSFNAPLGMCPTCNGLGVLSIMDESKVIPDPDLSIEEGAILPWKSYIGDSGEVREGSWGGEKLKAIQKAYKIDLGAPWRKLPKKQKDSLLYGTGDEEHTIRWQGQRGSGTFKVTFEGILPGLMRRYQETQSDTMKTWYQKFLTNKPCHSCRGMRLKPSVLAVKIASQIKNADNAKKTTREKSIIEFTQLTIGEAQGFIDGLVLTKSQELIAKELCKEIRARLGFLVNVGLDYLTLDRKGPTLSGGEAQRIRLASQIGSELTGVLYILDEPSIGLHQRDNQKLLQTLRHLRDIGNTLIVVEHDEETISAADWVLDIGPGAGLLGGRIVAAGTPEDIKKDPHSLTGAYLSGREAIGVPAQRRTVDQAKGSIVIEGAQENNLKNVTVSFPLGVMTAVTGVSGAGKSTLINQILYPALARLLHDSDETVGVHKKILGLKNLDKVINIDQRPIGRTPRSNPATYTKVFDLIRDFFAQLPEARSRGFDKGRFSFNVKGGRCEPCQGDGYLKVEMHFLADVLVPCEVCRGRRFNEATLQIKYKDYSIADVLDLSVLEACEVFKHHPKVTKILKTLADVGLTYVKLGQPATTLSGGEAQRIKLARELARVDTGRTLYILDEPTTGLHFADIRKLLEVLSRLLDAGNTVVVIEHNLDVIKTSDWVIDMGPEGGHRGGEVIAQGTPEQVAKIKASVTGQFLGPLLGV
jgi:excinuclease ABC subunit A